MSIEDNKAVVRQQHEEVWSEGNLSLIDEIYTADFVCHFVGGQEWRGPQGVRRAVAGHRKSFPDWVEHIEDIIAEGDRVVTRFTSRGTHQGDFFEFPPTGNLVTVTEVSIYRMVDGKIAEQWGFPDQVELLRQLGANPPAAPSDS